MVSHSAAVLDRLKTEAALANQNGDKPILERSFQLAIAEIERLQEVDLLREAAFQCYVDEQKKDRAEIERLRKEVEQWRENDRMQREILAGAVP